MSPAIRPAATLVLLRQSAQSGLQVLLLERSSKLAFAAGKWVFPGGKVESSDFQQTETELDGFRRAAVRETHEEAGLVVSGSLHHFMDFVTPPSAVKRFYTSFFLSCYGDTAEEATDICVDGSEIIDARWITPEAALQTFREGNIPLMVPTGLILMRLACYEAPGLEKAVSGILSEPVFRVWPSNPGEGPYSDASLYPGDKDYRLEDLGMSGETLKQHALDEAPQGQGIHRVITDQQTGIWQYVHDTDSEEFPRLDGGYNAR